MKILEFYTIIIAMIMEGIILQTGSIAIIKDLIKNKKTYLKFIAFLLWAGSCLYILYCFLWCFDPYFIIKIAGITLLSLSLITHLIRKKTQNSIFIQIDSLISLICLLFIGIARWKGL